MRRTIIIAFLLGNLLALPCAAQQHQNPSAYEFEPVSAPPEMKGRPWGGYIFTTMLDFGYQHADVHKNLQVYRSQLNYTNNGPRLFDLNFQGRSETGTINHIWATAGGWGGDPYNWVHYGSESNNWFLFRGHYLRSDYFFDVPSFAENWHTNDQRRRRQSYDLTLFPKWPFRVRVSYNRNTSLGLAFTSLDFSRDEFLVFEPLRQSSDEARVGLDWHIQHWNFFLEQGWRRFRNERLLFLPGFSGGADPLPEPAYLNSLERSYPIRMSIPYSCFSIAGRPHRVLDVSARIMYSDPAVRYLRTEAFDGQTFDPPPPGPRNGVQSLIVQQIESLGNAGRPYTTLDEAVTVRPARLVTINHTLRYSAFTIAGSDFTTITTLCTPLGPPTVACATGTSAEGVHRRLRVENLRTRLESRVDLNRHFSVRAGFQFSDRDIPVAEFEDGLLEHLHTGDLNTNTFLLGFSARTHRRVQVFVDYERGDVNNNFTELISSTLLPIRGDLDRFRIRTRFEPAQGVRFNVSYFLFDFQNPYAFISSDQENRGFSIDFALNRSARWYWNLGYSRNDINALSDASFFVFSASRTGVSALSTNDNYFYADLGSHIYKGLHVELGYRGFSNTGLAGLFRERALTTLIVAVDPLSINFHQPHAALRYDFNERVSARIGYRWYGYNEKENGGNDYSAHIVAFSIRWTL